MASEAETSSSSDAVAEESRDCVTCVWEEARAVALVAAVEREALMCLERKASMS